MELSSTLIGFRPDRTLSFPINFTDLPLMGFQAYRNICIQDLFQENIRVPSSVNFSSFGGEKRSNHVRMQCYDESKAFYRCLPAHHLQIVSRIKHIIPRWMRHGNFRNILIGLCFLITTIIFNNYLVKIPYSKRAHFFPSSALRAESVVGEVYIKYMEWKYKGQILPPKHPTTILVESILKQIIIGLNNGLNLEHDERMTVSGQVPSATEEFHKSPKGTRNEQTSTSSTYEEMFNNLNLTYSRAHLERRNWELMVVDNYEFAGAYIVGTGRIVFSTTSIKYWCNSEADIAYILGHEIGHGLSLHTAREWLKLISVISCATVRLMGYYHSVPCLLVAYNIFEPWLSRRIESVADYVGLMLMASAGYDPRASPAFQTRLTKLDYEDYFFRSIDETFKRRRSRLKYYMKKMKEVVDFFIATHPPPERRAKSIEEVMGEAVAIYEQVRGGHEEEMSVNSFVLGSSTSRNGMKT